MALVKQRPRSEEGSTTPIAVVMIVAMLVFSGLFIDVAFAGVQQQIQTNDLASCRDELMSTPVSLEMKNSDNPGLFIAETAAASLRENGFDGAITVWFFEASADDVPSSRRAMAWAIQTEDSMPSLFIRTAGVAEMPISSNIVGSAMPYSLGDTWRPASSGNGVYTLAAGAEVTDLVYTPASASTTYPDEMIVALEERIEQAAAAV